MNRDRPPVVKPAAVGGFGDHPAQVCHTRQDGGNIFEMSLGVLRNQACQRGFTGSGWTGEDDGGEQAVGDDGAAQQLSLTDDVLLPNEFVQCARSQPGCQWGFVLEILFHGVVKKVHVMLLLV